MIQNCDEQLKSGLSRWEVRTLSIVGFIWPQDIKGLAVFSSGLYRCTLSEESNKNH